MKPVIYPGTLFDYTAGVYCGVLVTEPVMKRLAKLQAKHLEDVKRLLFDSAKRGDVFPKSWTLHYPKGDQTHVEFIDTSYTVEERLRYATIANPPRAHQLVFVAGSMQEAKEMADAHYLHTIEEFDPS